MSAERLEHVDRRCLLNAQLDPIVFRIMKLANEALATRLFKFALAMQVTTLTGCGGADRSELAPVSGQVTIDGTPVAQGSIRFYPAEGRMAIGEIVDGQYALRTYEENDGAVLGAHKVTIKAVETKAKKVPKFDPPPDATPAQIKELEVEMLEGMDAAFVWIVPEKYSTLSRTPLTAEVQVGENPINFSLKSE